MTKTIHYTLDGIDHSIPYETSTIPEHMIVSVDDVNTTFSVSYDFTPLLSLLRVWIELAAKHNIIYWAVDGTLLGCLRHQGIIPWDNDVDLCIRYDQYEKIRSFDFGEFEVATQFSGFQFRKRGTHIPFIDLFVYEVDPETNMLASCFPIHPVTQEFTFYSKIGNKMEFRAADLVNMCIVPFEDMLIPIPYNSLETLHRTYGDDAMTYLYYDNHVELHSELFHKMYLDWLPLYNHIMRSNHLLGLHDNVSAHNLDVVVCKIMQNETLKHHTRDMDDIMKSVSNTVRILKPFLYHHLTKWM